MEQAYNVFLMWVDRRTGKDAASIYDITIAEKTLTHHELNMYMALKNAYLMGVQERRKEWK